jgi:hypothetical protein
MNVTVRPAAAQDAAIVAEVLCESRREALPYAPMAHAADEVRAWMADVLIPGGGVYVAETQSRVIAMLAISRDAEGSWIDQLYVRPGCTGHTAKSHPT